MKEMYNSGFRKLNAWQEAHRLTLRIYNVTSIFPSSEKFGITSQLQRAASSVAAQIVEGSRMPTMPHRKIYYDRAYASAAEVDYFLQLAHDLGYLKEEQHKNLLELLNRVSALTYKLSASCLR